MVLEELHLTGNGATDASGPALVKFLDYGANLVNTLHIGDNQFTAATVKQLAALLPGHRYGGRACAGKDVPAAGTFLLFSSVV